MWAHETSSAMQNRMLGRVDFPLAPAPRDGQVGKTSAAPIAFKKDLLDTHVRSIDIIPYSASP
jgi:hypothetical protein